MPIHSNLLGAITTGIIGGLFDRNTAKATNSANVEANRANIAAQAANQEKGLQALTGSTPDATTTRTPDGGFNTAFTPGGSSDVLFQGDIGRAGALNRASENFGFKLPNLASAQGVVDRDNALAQRSFDEAFEQATLRGRQATGDIDTGYNSRTATALGDVANKLRTNREQSALNLFDQSGNNDLSRLQQQITSNQRQSPQLSSVGGTAANLIAQSPPSATISNLSGAVNSAAGSNFIAQIQQRIALDEAEDRKLNVIRALGDAGAWS
jgi:hypothetical protein